ncbi:Trm112 family protein [Psychromonas sp. 14N.309.X.WAT.B.A12]|uniref:Trm112 family protein n=1 Tax=unclassified Psychromonas TaxID=2614957 RepID=UPI0025B098B4|nr:Trm112 family protein [Psychromonas sp. 14N.309.X.WAT.B.A12]MDN2662002.1 Trm112 family protein [Psychromonas sp. 14N.309.X.WAT.B.A12]
MLDIKLLDIIACPVCKGKLAYDKDNNELICKFDHLAYPVRDGIPALLYAEARKMSADEE